MAALILYVGNVGIQMSRMSSKRHGMKCVNMRRIKEIVFCRNVVCVTTGCSYSDVSMLIAQFIKKSKGIESTSSAHNYHISVHDILSCT